MNFTLAHENNWKEYLFSNNWANIAWFFLGGICGTSFLALLFQKFGVTNWLLNAAFATLGLVTLKEILDTLSTFTQFKGKYGLDPNGGDLRDILLGFLGIVLTLIILSIKF